jgi:hypothetical protein
MSRVRGDGQFNPVVIPDLALDTPKISRSRTDPALRQFIRGLIVEEFDGNEPPARVLDGLTAYVRALDQSACAGKADQPVNTSVHIGELVLEMGVVRQSLADNDPQSARLAMTAVRHRLGQMAARYQDVKRDLQLLVKLDKEIAQIMTEPATDLRSKMAALDRWSGKLGRTVPRLIADEPQSLYNVERLRQWLAREAAVLPLGFADESRVAADLR